MHASRHFSPLTTNNTSAQHRSSCAKTFFRRISAHFFSRPRIVVVTLVIQLAHQCRVFDVLTPFLPNLSRSVIEIDAVQRPSFRRRRVRVLVRS